MRAHRHLKLIVSDPAGPAFEDVEPDRASLVRPVSGLRLQLLRLRQHARAAIRWSLAAAAVSVAAGIAASQL